MQRYCVCQVPIPANRDLCVTCRKLYGVNPAEWPEWLRVWMKSYKAERDYERRHPHISLDAIIEKELR